MGLVETWMEEESWKKMKNRLSKSHNWWYISAKKEKKKGREINYGKENIEVKKFTERGEGVAEIKIK